MDIKLKINNEIFIIQKGINYVVIDSQNSEIEILNHWKSVNIINFNRRIKNSKAISYCHEIPFIKVSDSRNNIDLRKLEDAYLLFLDKVSKEYTNAVIFFSPDGCDPKGVERIIDNIFDTERETTFILFLSWRDYADLFEPDIIKTLTFNHAKQQKITTKNHFKISPN